MYEFQAKGMQEDDVLGKNSVFSRNMTQLIVCLSGMFFTICAFLILSLLVQQMVADDHALTQEEAVATVTERLLGLEDSINTTGYMLGLLIEDVDKYDIKNDFTSNVGDIKVFDRVFMAELDEGAEWSIKDIIDNKSDGLNNAALKSLIHSVLSKYEATEDIRRDSVIVISDLQGAQEWQAYTDPVVKGRAFAMAKLVRSSQDRQVFIIGVGKVTALLGKEWFANRPSLKRLAILDQYTSKQIFLMDRDFSADSNYASVEGEITTPFRLGDSQWQISLSIGANSQALFLKQTPLVIFILGSFLTLLCTIYVRSNQRQAYKLAQINSLLSQKNYELSREVSERERLNQIVRKAEREYRAIIDSVSDIIFETTVDGEVTLLNETWSKVTGFEIDQVIGRNIFDLLHPQDQEEQRNNFAMLIKGKKGAYRTFTRLKSSDGSFRSVELAMSMLRQDENKQMRVVGTFTDVEERRRAEKALSEAEKKYRTIVENAAGGIYQVTPEGQFLSVNPAMARVLGYDSVEQLFGEIKNAHQSIYVNPKEREMFIRDLETSGVVYNFESLVKRRDGAEIWVNENARAVRDDDGNTLYYEGSLEDVTGRKAAEISLKEAKKQSDFASRAKSEFLANMSHELRTPLNAIIGFSEIIKDEVLGPLQNKQYWDYANDIHSSGQRLLGIINEILDVARIEAGERQLNEGVVKTGQVLASVLSYFEDKAKDGNIKLTDMTGGKLPDIIGEELAIKQVLINVVGNALKYTPPEGRVTIAHEIDTDNNLRLSVTDTGVGMNDHEIKKALSPFGQADASFSRTEKGTGLGLTLCLSLVELHDGGLEIFSQKGIGTTVTVVMPAKRIAVDSKHIGGRDTDSDDDIKADGEKESGDGGSIGSRQIH